MARVLVGVKRSMTNEESGKLPKKGGRKRETHKKSLAQGSNISGQSFIHCCPLFIHIFYALAVKVAKNFEP